MRKIGAFIWYQNLHFDGWIQKWSRHTPLSVSTIIRQLKYFWENVIHKILIFVYKFDSWLDSCTVYDSRQQHFNWLKHTKQVPEKISKPRKNLVMSTKKSAVHTSTQPLFKCLNFHEIAHEVNIAIVLAVYTHIALAKLSLLRFQWINCYLTPPTKTQKS